ncbi:MAG: type II secretion system protein [Candidatus Aminicenantes bacterium]|jgi:type II secretory pathway pseudopilin PulG
MIKGFTILELIVALTIGLSILIFVISNASASTTHSKRVISNQERMESIFHTVEMIRSDLTKCGMRLLEPAKCLGFPLFVNSDYSFKVIYGIETETLINAARQNATAISINRNDFFKKGKRIAIYDPDNRNYEINEIQAVKGERLILLTGLQDDYPTNSSAVVLKEVEYKHYADQNILKRKVNKGYFQPLIEEVTDFYVKFFPESCSVFYRIEVNKKEQIRGYIFMTNMVAR